MAAALAADADLISQIKAASRGNDRLSGVEQIKRFRILPAFWEPGGDGLTLTMKLRRRPIAQKYAIEIDAALRRVAGSGRTRTGTRRRADPGLNR